MKWFGIKTVHITKVKGKPSVVDSLYDANSALLEERVVLIRARSADEAILKGNKEAEAYSRETIHMNSYGQKVATNYLGVCDAYELFESPDNYTEVFSATRIINKNTKAETVKDMLFGKRESKYDLQKRKKFLNAELHKNK